MPDYIKAAQRAARKYGVDPQVFVRQIGAESGFNPNAKSPAGAEGIAQFIPSTAKAYGVNLHDSRVTDDLEGAARYMAANLRQTGGNYHRALSIYNSGRADGYKSIPETRNYVSKILNGVTPTSATPSSGASSGGGTRTVQTTKTIPGVDNSATRRALILQFAQQGAARNPAAVTALAQSLPDATDTPARTVMSTRTVATAGSPRASVPAGGRTVEQLKAEAQKISSSKVPYQWGGGHGAAQPAGSKVTPLDCSGAVSRVFGINPRVASQFEKFGSAGQGKRVTIYAKGTHVLMELDGHFFGTSSANPGGGAGWIPRAAIGRQYLAGFTARHPAGL